MRTKTPLMLMLITIPLAFAACVPTAKYDEALAAGAALQLDLDVSEAARRAAEAEGERLGQALADETTRREALDSLVEVLRERNDTLKQELQRLSDQLTDITASSRRDRERKAALEELVAHLQDTSAETERQMLEAEQRIADLKAEREVLLAEKEVLEEKTSEYDALVDSLQSEIQAGQITITELQGKLTLQLSNAILFDSGSIEVKQAGRDALIKVAGVLGEVTDRAVRVEGHTDNVPVGAGAYYRDNWGLSALRASVVTTLLVEHGVDPHNVAAVGYADTHPVAENETAEGKAANRRTEIVLVPRLEAAAVVAPEETETAP